MTLDELLKQKADLDRQIAQYQKDGRAKAIADIQVLMAQNGLTAADLVEPTRKGSKTGASAKPVAAKYKDNNGNAWSGRGLKPKWLSAALASGKTLSDFTVRP